MRTASEMAESMTSPQAADRARIAELEAALVGLILACDVDDVYEEDKSDRPAMVAARAAIRQD